MDVSIALSVLEKDKARNINIINFIKSYPIHSVSIVGDSVMIRGRSDEDWVYISSRSEEELLQIRGYLDKGDKCFAVLEDWMLPHIISGREVRSRLSSIKLVYDSVRKAPPVKSPVINLTEADAPYIYENSKYKEFIDTGYIRDRIRKGIGTGIAEDGRLVAWALTHDDGAIGFLNVLEDYRRKGYGSDVTAAIIGKQLERGEVPFVHVEPENQASLRLARKAGFRENGRVHWIKLRN